MSNMRRRPAWIALAVVLLVYGAVLKHYSSQGWGRYFPQSQTEGSGEAAIKREFLRDGAQDAARYRALFGYFLAGALRYTDSAGSRIQYPGVASNSGYAVSGLEGFARTGTLLAAWVASGRDTTVWDSGSGRSVDLVAYLKRALLAGTDPRGDGYWGRIRDLDQRGVEAADVARILWLTCEHLWERLNPPQQNRIAAWLRQVDGRETPNTVWLLFPLTVDLVLHSLGAGRTSGAELPSAPNYLAFKKNYLGDGWFSDPPHGVDFYNTWGMSYELFWITRVDPGFDPEFIRSALRQSADLTAHLIAPDGVPLMGRSLCYRTAVSVPLLAEQAIGDQAPADSTKYAGLARRALDRTWRHFIAHGALQDGALTQGYYRTDLRFVDYYTGAGSCHWGLRSLVLALMQAPDATFWRAAEQPLPVELGDYRLDYRDLGWIVSGDHASGRVTVEIPANAGNSPRTRPHAVWRRWLELLFRRPFRPSNEDMQYTRAAYSSDAPLIGD